MSNGTLFRGFLAAVLAYVCGTPGYGSPVYFMTDLTVAAGLGEAHACAVNDSGTVTGFVDSSAYGLSELYDINDVGMMLGKRKSDGKLAVRHPDGSTSALPTYAGQQTLVCGMNNLGWVVGFASGVNHALLWRPVPEPSSILALLCGIGGLAAAARKRGSAH